MKPLKLLSGETITIETYPPKAKGKKPKKNSKPKKKSGKKKSNMNAGNKSNAKMAMVRQVCSITDPFCPAAKGARFPDGTGGNSIAFQMRGVVNITTGTASGSSTGAAIYVIAPGAYYGLLNGASFSGSTWTMNGTYAAFTPNSLLANNAAKARVVSAGAIVRGTCSMSNAQGQVYMSEAPGTVTFSSGLTQCDFAYPNISVTALTTGFEKSWISKPQGNIARQFQSVNANNSYFPGWTNLVVEVNGGPASIACVAIEYFINVEFQLQADNSLSQLAPKSTAASPVVIKANSDYQNKQPTIIAGGASVVEKTVASGINSIATKFGDMALSALDDILMLL